MTRPRILTLAFLIACLAQSRTGLAAEGDADDTFFELKIRPVLAGICFTCHGGKKTSAGLRVDSREAILKGGENGEAIIPGDPDSSLMIQAMRHAHESLKMPPGKRLPEEVVADFGRWVKSGAPWPKASSKESKESENAFATTRHWAFDPVKPVFPPNDPTGWSDNPIDRFVAARRTQAGLSPVQASDKRSLLRRVTFDLIGLPPTPEEIEDFLKDDAPDAFERVVERLLASPHYGERWGRHWMDVIRYADTAGDNADYPVPELARYRDYIISSFNRDKPFDQFVREQLAGDLLNRPGENLEKYAESIVATGYLALSRRYATAPFELWHLTLEDTIDTTGRAFLGLTMRCARCHDHKFDPISQKEYYALYGIFASTTFPFAGAEEFSSKKTPRLNFVPTVASDEVRKKVEHYAADVEAMGRERDRLEAEAKASKDPKRQKELQDRLKASQAAYERLRRRGLPNGVPGAYAVTDGKPVDVALQRSGDPATPGPVVPRAVPALGCLTETTPPPVPAGSSGRLELARWLTRPDHPLTARVMVNRIWQGHFGRGIVASSSNFGLRGEQPTHPELLDWLAARFVASGWSVKAIHRLIVSSRTYQLSSESDSTNAQKDPGNRLLWRYERRRLDAEAIRDAMLMVSGVLDLRTPGLHPFPPIENWRWTQHDAFKERYPSNRRSVYLMTQRLIRDPYLATFDGPDTNTSTEARTRSTVPLQALYLMNDPSVGTRATAFADRLLAATADPAGRIAFAHELAWGRPPRLEELERSLRFIEGYVQNLERAGTPSDRVVRDAWRAFGRILLIANEFLYID